MAAWEPGAVICPRCGKLKGVYESGEVTFPCCRLYITVKESMPRKIV